MERNTSESVSVTRFVLAGLAVKIVVGAAFAIYALYNPGFDPGNQSTPASIAAIGVGLGWYAKSVNRPMQESEIWRFGLGTAVADLLLSIAWAILVTVLSNQPLTLEGFDNAIFNGSGFIYESDKIGLMMFLLLFSLLMTFGLAALFAWIMTRKLPRSK